MRRFQLLTGLLVPGTQDIVSEATPETGKPLPATP